MNKKNQNVYSLQTQNLKRKLSCTLVPGSYPNRDPVPPVYNALYGYWRATWSDFFEKAGSPPGSLNIENFFRHTFIIVLHQDDTIAGTLSSSLFNLGANATYDHPHISPFSSVIQSCLTESDPGLCLTGEYLSVHPRFRKELSGVSLAEVMIGVLMKIFVAVEGRYALASTVRKAKVDLICKDYGYTEIGSYLKCGVDCVTLFNTQETRVEHPNPTVCEFVDHLWRIRNDLTGRTHVPAARHQEAA